jgi:hypothetical protein
MRRLATTTFTLGLALTVGLAGCGGGGGEASKSAAQIAKDAANAAAAATSVHISGTAAAQGQKVPVDIRMSKAGAVGTGSFAGTTVQLVRVGANLYVKGAQDVLGTFLGAAAKQKADGHWVEIPVSLPQLEQLSAATDFSTFPTTFKATGTPTKTGTRTVDGKKVVALKGFGPDGAATLLVAATGTPYPVQLITSDGTLTFSDWDAPVSVQKPTDVVPLSSLTG